LTLTVSPSLSYFVTGGITGDVRVWDFKEKRLRAVYKDHIMSVTGLHVTGDDQFIVSSAKDCNIIVTGRDSGTRH
ncbi:hypothetical protein KIPB_015262, partial [Kipferlia bialata]